MEQSNLLIMALMADKKEPYHQLEDVKVENIANRRAQLIRQKTISETYEVWCALSSLQLNPSPVSCSLFSVAQIWSLRHRYNSIHLHLSSVETQSISRRQYALVFRAGDPDKTIRLKNSYDTRDGLSCRVVIQEMD